jgi:8-oxo-dGTP diphosphatase
MPRLRVSGFLQREGRLLLVEHTKAGRSYYLLPGGGAEEQENLEVSLEREFKEELAMQITVGPLLLLAQTLSPDGSRNIVHLVFLVSSEEEPSYTGEDERVSGFIWVEPQKALTLPFYPDILKRLLELKADSSYNGVVVEFPEWLE